ncbi:histone RNA hairpin-binding protein isoform X1 [Drosophila obscura]|uniref:histone RNA hairpin-binding protein isoform X1 n=1 Tax=Drosophila obscura TaxID=7282 RepID=UPI000BA15E83|nr:histone RNA hairpin-binding protein isoform X1 [Drosophila obscura]
MLCEDQLMSVDNTPVKGSGSLNSSASSISIDVKPIRQSWAKEVRAEFGHSDEASTSLNSSAASSNADQGPVCVKMEATEVKLELVDGVDRGMAFEFLDDVNEVKFDRLLKEEKLKTPYKRRHSQTPPTNENSRSNSPNSSLSSASGDPNPNANANTNPKSKQSNFKGHKEEKRVRHNSYTSSTSSSSSYTEADPAVLSRRQKQIDYGKNTAAYERYNEMVPKATRSRENPRTPNKYGKYSRRAFDGLVKIWRKSLHFYDPPTQRRGEASSNTDSDSD